VKKNLFMQIAYINQLFKVKMKEKPQTECMLKTP